MPSDTTTRGNILQAAADLFAEEGFQAATVRAIAARAGANIAAINYHFRDKESLYAEVLTEVFRDSFTRFPATMEVPPEAPPEERLRGFIRGMCLRLLSSGGWGGATGRGRLIARELLQPSPAFDGILEGFVRPHKTLLTAIITALLGSDPGPQVLNRCAVSVISQCVYLALAGPVIRRITNADMLAEEQLDSLSRSIWLFSLGGIARIRQELAAPDMPIS